MKQKNRRETGRQNIRCEIYLKPEQCKARTKKKVLIEWKKEDISLFDTLCLLPYGEDSLKTTETNFVNFA